TTAAGGPVAVAVPAGNTGVEGERVVRQDGAVLGDGDGDVGRPVGGHRLGSRAGRAQPPGHPSPDPQERRAAGVPVPERWTWDQGPPPRRPCRRSRPTGTVSRRYQPVRRPP